MSGSIYRDSLMKSVTSTSADVSTSDNTTSGTSTTGGRNISVNDLDPELFNLYNSVKTGDESYSINIGNTDNSINIGDNSTNGGFFDAGVLSLLESFLSGVIDSKTPKITDMGIAKSSGVTGIRATAYGQSGTISELTAEYTRHWYCIENFDYIQRNYYGSQSVEQQKFYNSSLYSSAPTWSSAKTGNVCRIHYLDFIVPLDSNRVLNESTSEALTDMTMLFLPTNFTFVNDDGTYSFAPSSYDILVRKPKWEVLAVQPYIYGRPFGLYKSTSYYYDDDTRSTYDHVGNNNNYQEVTLIAGYEVDDNDRNLCYLRNDSYCPLRVHVRATLWEVPNPNGDPLERYEIIQNSSTSSDTSSDQQVGGDTDSETNDETDSSS